MKTLAVMCMLMLAGASGAGAVDIKGKWGIGAGVFGGGGEASLIRGKSERSAWIFDVAINQRYEQASAEVSPPPAIPPGLSVDRSFSVAAGPGYRRFTRPSEDLTPYWDVRLRGRYAKRSRDAGDFRRTDTGIDADLSIGLEYATPWRFSVAAHSGLARVSWVRSVDTRDLFPGEVRTTYDSETFSIGIAPVLYVRAYF